jgi:hypothetical protein
MKKISDIIMNANVDTVYKIEHEKIMIFKILHELRGFTWIAERKEFPRIKYANNGRSPRQKYFKTLGGCKRHLLRRIDYI